MRHYFKTSVSALGEKVKHSQAASEQLAPLARSTRLVMAPAVISDRAQPIPRSRGVSLWTRLQWRCCGRRIVTALSLENDEKRNIKQTDRQADRHQTVAFANHYGRGQCNNIITIIYVKQWNWNQSMMTSVSINYNGRWKNQVARSTGNKVITLFRSGFSTAN